jgi:hypothetical protein
MIIFIANKCVPILWSLMSINKSFLIPWEHFDSHVFAMIPCKMRKSQHIVHSTAPSRVEACRPYRVVVAVQIIRGCEVDGLAGRMYMGDIGGWELRLEGE